MPRCFTLVVIIAVQIAAIFAAARTFAADSRSIVNGKVRFQVLSPELVRMEYSPKAHFIDDASVAVVGRANWPGIVPTTEEKNGWLNVSTGKITLSYKLNSGLFAKENLRIRWRDNAGEHSWRPGDKDDRNLGGVPLSMDNLTAPVADSGPLSRNGYYHLDDSRTALFDKATDWVKPRPEEDSQDWYFLVYGNDFAAGLQSLAKLIGPIPMLPRYVFGAWFGSRAGYSAEQWKMIVDRFREEGFPLDVLVLDSWSTTKVSWSGYDWDYEQMPDPKGFFEWMKRRNVKVTVNEHYQPLTRESDSSFEAIRKAMGLPANITEIPHDIANKKYAGLFMDLLHKPALDMGMAFWWEDGCAATSMKGLDPYLWTRHLEYTASERITGRRTTAFCRLGTAVGSHRYGVYFTGDLIGHWESLPLIIPATIRGGNQLMPYMNNLCCGVHVFDLPPELYQRWIQFNAFSPLIWFHGIWGLRMPWEYGQAGEETYRRFIGLRYGLLPYIYSYSRVAHDSGLPLVRGMYLDYPQQEAAYTSEQQYMFGRELLVAPVTKPGNGNPAKTQVFLPAGDDWIDYFTGDIYEGGRKTVHECPLSRMPLFVRAGSIVPTGPKLEYTDQSPADPLTLDVYAGRRPAAFTLYEDDGTSLDYRNGACARTVFRFAPTADSDHYTLTIGPTSGTFRGQLESRRYAIRVHGLLKPSDVTVGAEKLPETPADGCGPGWTWDANTRTTTIRLPAPVAAGQQLAVELSGAGTFADAVALQKAINLREQVRQAKRVMKAAHFRLLGYLGTAKPPQVIRTAEQVEQELTAAINSPSRIGSNPPDFTALRQRVLHALTDNPFESNRRIPYVPADSELIAGSKALDNGKFTAAEINAIREMLRGADLPAWLFHPL
jgi:alpha-glucosidase